MMVGYEHFSLFHVIYASHVTRTRRGVTDSHDSLVVLEHKHQNTKIYWFEKQAEDYSIRVYMISKADIMGTSFKWQLFIQSKNKPWNGLNCPLMRKTVRKMEGSNVFKILPQRNSKYQLVETSSWSVEILICLWDALRQLCREGQGEVLSRTSEFMILQFIPP